LTEHSLALLLQAPHIRCHRDDQDGKCEQQEQAQPETSPREESGDVPTHDARPSQPARRRQGVNGEQFHSCGFAAVRIQAQRAQDIIGPYSGKKDPS
jgi:hypothetical protein